MRGTGVGVEVGSTVAVAVGSGEIVGDGGAIVKVGTTSFDLGSCVFAGVWSDAPAWLQAVIRKPRNRKKSVVLLLKCAIN